VSTRGVIARQKGDFFEGRYHHWDSYPSGLGKALWELAHNQFKGNLDEMLHILIDEHPAGWSTIVNKDFAITPGFNEYGKGNCLTCGKPSWEHYYQEWESHGKRLTARARQSMAKGNYMALGHSYEGPRFTNAECYCHGDRNEDELVVTEKNAADIGCEYAYVFSTNGMMTILSSYNGDGSKMIGMFGMGNPEAKWGVLAVIPLDGAEPDWHSLQGW
jgi:hypothetical protein